MFDKIIRYSEVDRFLHNYPGSTILEIGAGPLGLGACLPYRFVGVDVWYPEPPIDSQLAVRASGLCLPFRDSSFDVVLCIEVLEHLPLAIRRTMVEEMCRVARRAVLITHPYGRIARIGDRALGVAYDMLKLLGKGRPWWLIEHLQQPYPNPAEYLPSPLHGFRFVQQGHENAILHPVVVFVTHLKVVSRVLKRVHNHSPKITRTLAHLIDFPPFARKAVILVREEE